MEKTTDELLEMMKNSATYAEYISKNGDVITDTMKIDRVLSALLEQKKLKKAAVIAASTIEVHYGYQIFSGEKTPSRDKVIMLCFGFGLTLEETQNLLKITGYTQLYGKNFRDNAIIFAIIKQLSIIELNLILDELGLELLL